MPFLAEVFCHLRWTRDTLLAAKDTLPILNADVSNSNTTAAIITFTTLGVGMAGVAAYIFTRKKKKFED